MKPSLLFFLLALHLLLSVVEGIRIDVGFKSAIQHRNNETKNIDDRVASNNDVGGLVACEGGGEKCAYSSGKISRKLTMPTTPSTTKTRTTSQNMEIINTKGSEPKVHGLWKEEEEEDAPPEAASPSPDSNNRDLEVVSGNNDGGDDKYHGTIEITEMDYSSAQRKPPIHN